MNTRYKRCHLEGQPTFTLTTQQLVYGPATGIPSSDLSRIDFIERSRAVVVSYELHSLGMAARCVPGRKKSRRFRALDSGPIFSNAGVRKIFRHMDPAYRNYTL
jgi:hypothetical protein